MIDWENHCGDLLAEAFPYKVIACHGCKFAHVVPLPSEAMLAMYYQKTFYARSHPDYLAHYLDDRSWWEIVHATTLRQAATHLLAFNGEQRRVIDIGTGPGLFLDVARMLNWDTYGIEPDISLVQRSVMRGHVVAPGTLAEYEAIAPLHLAHAYEVLEHVPDPEAFLQQVRRLLYPGGLLALTVPNDFNPLQIEALCQFDLDAWWVQPPEHLNYFDPTSLAALVEHNGFRIIEVTGTFPMEVFLLKGHNYIGNDALGRKCHKRRMYYETEAARAGNWNVLQALYHDNMIDHGIGREIRLMAQRLD